MTDQEGNHVDFQRRSYVIHALLGGFSEVLIRVIISFVATLALASFNAGLINATVAALAKGLALGAVIMLMGRVSAYSRLENLWASWWPSSSRMFSRYSIQPYADLIHVLFYTVLQYAGSLIGVALALWISNFATVNLGLPSNTADLVGTIGAYSVTTSDLWIIEIVGSALITFAWLMTVVYQQGVAHHVYAGLVTAVCAFAVTAVTITGSGANFDFIHYAAMRTVLSGANGVNTSHTAAYLVGPLIGALIAWVGYLIAASLGFAGSYSRPGIPKNSAAAGSQAYAASSSGFNSKGPVRRRNR